MNGNQTPTAYPLYWPEHFPRSKRPGSSKFKTSLPGALRNVEDSLRRFGDDSGKKITNLVISSNVTLGQQRPADAGVALYFTWDDMQTCIAVDRYSKVEDNLQAIHHCIEAERVKLRHGGIELVKAAFRGYVALPPPEGVIVWHEVLGVSPHAEPEAIEKAYHELRSQHHPDHGGDPVMFDRIQRAWKLVPAEKRS